LNNKILIRFAGLEIELRELKQEDISKLGDLKLQSYSGFKIELLKSRKSEMRKFDGKDLGN